MSCAYEDAIREEIARWPGVEVSFGHRTKHREATLHFGGKSRFIIYPDSPSDERRGALNCIPNVRQELRTLGAKRLETQRKERIRRNRNKPMRDTLAHIQAAPVKANPFEALRSVQFAAQETPTRSAETLWGSVRRMVARWLKAMRP